MTLPNGPEQNYFCTRCGHTWPHTRPAEERPRICPKCKSPYWDKEPRSGPERRFVWVHGEFAGMSSIVGPFESVDIAQNGTGRLLERRIFYLSTRDRAEATKAIESAMKEKRIWNAH